MSKTAEERRRRLEGLAEPRERDLPARRPSASAEPSEEHDSIVAFFGGAVRKGLWEPAERITVNAIFGGAELDFREAEMLEGVTEVQVFALFGGVEIKVPNDIDVECSGSGIFGGFSHHAQRSDEEAAPLLRIRGTAVFGGVEVKAPKPKRWRPWDRNSDD